MSGIFNGDSIYKSGGGGGSSDYKDGGTLTEKDYIEIENNFKYDFTNNNHDEINFVVDESQNINIQIDLKNNIASNLHIWFFDEQNNVYVEQTNYIGSNSLSMNKSYLLTIGTGIIYVEEIEEITSEENLYYFGGTYYPAVKIYNMWWICRNYSSMITGVDAKYTNGTVYYKFGDLRLINFSVDGWKIPTRSDYENACYFLSGSYYDDTLLRTKINVKYKGYYTTSVQQNNNQCVIPYNNSGTLATITMINGGLFNWGGGNDTQYYTIRLVKPV